MSVHLHPSFLSMRAPYRAIWRLGNLFYNVGRRLINNRWNWLALSRVGERVAIAGISLRIFANHGIMYWLGRNGTRCLYVTLNRPPMKRANRGD